MILIAVFVLVILLVLLGLFFATGLNKLRTQRVSVDEASA